MTFLGFIGGMLVMGLGVLIVSRTHFFIQNFGEADQIFGLYGKPWASWKLLGIIIIFIGFFIAFGLFGLLAEVISDRFLRFGEY